MSEVNQSEVSKPKSVNLSLTTPMPYGMQLAEKLWSEQ